MVAAGSEELVGKKTFEMVSLGGLFLKKHLCESPGHQSVQVECSEVVEGSLFGGFCPLWGTCVDV